MYFDAHSDLWSDVTIRRLRGERDVLATHHIQRLQKGHVEGGIFAIWVDPPYDDDPAARTAQIMDCIQAEEQACDDICIVHSYREMMQAKRNGKIYAFIGMEGLAAMGEDLSKLDDYFRFGVRHAMLTWNEENALGFAAATGRHLGLTALGKQTIRCMQAKKMLVDVSHLNEAGFWDIIRLATAPIVASHSNCKALCDVPRNLTDNQMRAIRDVNGVVGLNAYHGFIDHDPVKKTVEQLARHAIHMIEVMGVDHVGCGFDFLEFLHQDDRGRVQPPSGPYTVGLEDCTQIYHLFRCLEEMGLSGGELKKIACFNMQRVIQQTIG